MLSDMVSMKAAWPTKYGNTFPCFPAELPLLLWLPAYSSSYSFVVTGAASIKLSLRYIKYGKWMLLTFVVFHRSLEPAPDKAFVRLYK
jgi:hypothetical protein